MIAIGTATPPAVHAVALERELFEFVELSDGVSSWSDYLREPVDSGKLVHAVHGALRVYDLTDLVDSLPDGMVVRP